MTELEASGVGDAPPPYIIFVVVFLFFLTGLLGFLVCHLLKKKGYRCRTGDMDNEEEEEEEEEKFVGTTDEHEENQDTVEQILKCIIENEANMEAFNEMLGNRNVCVRHDQRLRKESIGGIPPHLHTVHSGTDHNTCLLCAQVRSKKGRRHSRTPRSKQRPGEQTVFSVGRFRVTHHDKKIHGGANPMVGSGDQLDQSQDSEERKEGGYNLRSMFKDVRPPSESSNGIAPNIGKRRRSLTIFGLRRGSDPAGIKVREGTGRETGAVRFTIQPQPVVMEEQLQTDNNEVNPDCFTIPGVKPETESSKNPMAKTWEDSTNVPSPETGVDPMIKLSSGSTATSVPSSLPLPSPASSEVAFKKTEKGGNIEGKVLSYKDVNDPGPLQTSTPLAPTHGSISSFSPVIHTSKSQTYSSKGFPVTETPPDPCSSPDLEPGVGASRALISLGSSPPSSLQINAPLSVSLSKTPTRPLSITTSPKLISRYMPSEAPKTSFTPPHTQSPIYPPGQETSSQSPVPPLSFVKGTSPSQAQSSNLSPTTDCKIDTIPVSQNSPSSSTAERNLSIESSLPMTLMPESEMSESSTGKGLEDISPAKLCDSEGSGLSSSIDKLTKGRMSYLPLSPLSPLSPSSPMENKVSKVTIIKASPDSRREFSVVTMVEEEQPSTSIKDQKGETSDVSLEKKSLSNFGQPASHFEELAGADERSMLCQDKDDMVEMDDIRDCKVTQVEKAASVDEELV